MDNAGVKLLNILDINNKEEKQSYCNSIYKMKILKLSPAYSLLDACGKEKKL